MTEQEIVFADHAKNHSEYSLEQCMTAWMIAGLRDDIKKYRSGNSLLFVQDLGKGRGHFHFLNADRAEQFCENIKKCMVKVKEDGFKEITTDYKNPKVTEVAKATGLNIEFSTKNHKGEDKLWLMVRL